MFTKNQYIKRKGHELFRRILSVHDGVVDISYAWYRKNALTCNNNGLRDEQRYGVSYTIDQLNAYFVLATAEEAGFPEEERWRPTDGEKYWFVDSTGFSDSSEWRGSDPDEYRYRTGNCFKTVEEAEAYYDSVMTD